MLAEKTKRDGTAILTVFAAVVSDRQCGRVSRASKIRIESACGHAETDTPARQDFDLGGPQPAEH